LHQNVWKRVSGLYPDTPGEPQRGKGRKEDWRK